MKKIFALILLFVTVQIQAQKFEGLAETPPMGWNSWNTFGTNINEQLVKDIADKFVELGLKDAGYEYIVLDDGWMARERDENGNLVPDPIKFPNGMKAVADYVHSKGLKFGLYNCAGAQTCAGYPGSRGYEYQDARSYASWDVDYLKYDWCNTEKLNAEGAYMTMRDALKAAGRPVVFSICEWGDNEPWKWAKDIGHLWRVTGDIINCWDCEVGHGSWSSWGIWKIIDMRKDIRGAAGPGHWNDLDMMEVGNGMTDAEDRSHFAMWSIMTSPLIMGNDLRSASKETIKTLSNKEVVAINQDKLGIQGFRFTNENGLEIWLKPLANNAWAMVFVNMQDEEVEIDFDFAKHDIGDDVHGRMLDPKHNVYNIRDLFNHKNLGDTSKNMKAKIGVHDVLMIKLEKK
ncbi:glycoside hydrolase family 27 protein [Mangrovimonas sp. YM274]|uniref:glycoside hydrolase family 27 protein n=1 Tax=Mangrovimonas sp. YM274 TaxID=3070660 RepID=UPI0027DE66E6|nr:glycoside hydrolase family 27 protein [Mangrovimonas sp. YM274]WMI68593.1 glycoside hydrolase family 27 protein [Mangrovimonas sp. YM274]